MIIDARGRLTAEVLREFVSMPGGSYMTLYRGANGAKRRVSTIGGILEAVLGLRDGGSGEISVERGEYTLVAYVSDFRELAERTGAGSLIDPGRVRVSVGDESYDAESAEDAAAWLNKAIVRHYDPMSGLRDKVSVGSSGPRTLAELAEAGIIAIR